MKKKKKNLPEKEPSELLRADISKYLDSIKFKKKIFGGVSEYDVWRIIKQLDSMYNSVFDNQQNKYKGLILEREQWYKNLKQKYEALADKEDEADEK